MLVESGANVLAVTKEHPAMKPRTPWELLDGNYPDACREWGECSCCRTRMTDTMEATDSSRSILNKYRLLVGPPMKKIATKILEGETGLSLANRLFERMLRSGPAGKTLVFELLPSLVAAAQEQKSTGVKRKRRHSEEVWATDPYESPYERNEFKQRNTSK